MLNREFIEITQSLLAGTKSNEGFLKAKENYLSFRQQHPNESSLLVFMITNGIFNHYQELYVGVEQELGSHLSKNMFELCEFAFSNFGFYCVPIIMVLTLPTLIVSAVSYASIDALDINQQIALYRNLSTVDARLRDTFMAAVVRNFQEEKPYFSCGNTGPSDALISILNSSSSTDDKWCQLVSFVVNMEENNATPLLHCINEIARAQAGHHHHSQNQHTLFHQNFTALEPDFTTLDIVNTLSV